MSPMIDNAPLPAVDETSQPFWDGTALGELRVQRCAACGTRRFPPRPMCPACQSLDVEWEAMSGRATVWSFIVPHPPLLPAFMPVAPYNVIVVALDEDPALRMVGNLIADADASINSVDPATITIGEAVRVVFQPAGEEIVLPRWVRA
ncbi:MAG: hypothetical protein JWO37_2813 [Acidimicrobiales bacterium]|nr:hypothetical protein [Acidimicrobiales bacterium]